MAGAWSCPHLSDDFCTRVGGRPCQPGMRGCVLHGRYTIFDGDSLYPPLARAADKKLEIFAVEVEAEGTGS